MNKIIICCWVIHTDYEDIYDVASCRIDNTRLLRKSFIFGNRFYNKLRLISDLFKKYSNNLYTISKQESLAITEYDINDLLFSFVEN